MKQKYCKNGRRYNVCYRENNKGAWGTYVHITTDKNLLC